MSEKNRSGPGGPLGHPSCTVPIFHKSKPNKGDGCSYYNENCIMNCCTTVNLAHHSSVFISPLLPSVLFGHLTSFGLAPLWTARASDLLNVSSVSGSAALRRQQPGEWGPMGEKCAESATYYEVSSCSFLMLTNKRSKTTVSFTYYKMLP